MPFFLVKILEKVGSSASGDGVRPCHAVPCHKKIFSVGAMKIRSLLAAAALGSARAFVPPQTRSASGSITALDATVAVFGASGLTAQECVYQALKDGDTVVGLTRKPENVVIPKGSGGADAGKPISDPKLTLIGGDVTNADDVAKGERL